MSEWQKGNLGEFINLKRGYDLPSKSRVFGEFPIISSSGITDYHNEPKVFEGGVITGRYGTIGQVFYTDKPFHPLNTTLYVQDFKDNNKKFVYYFLKELDWEKFSDKSAVPGINRNDVHQEIVSFPPLPEQQAIASMLSSLDVKIDLLNRQNKTLEAMAETLFRQWFIEEAKDDWEEILITDLFEVKDGTHDSPKQSEVGFHLITSKHIHNGQIDFDSAYLVSNIDYEKINQRSKVEQFDILFSMIGTLGLIYIEMNEKVDYAIKNIGLFKTSQNPKWCYFLYLWLKSSFGNEFIEENKSGSTQEYISLGSLRKINFKVPNVEKIDVLNSAVDKQFNKIFANKKQIQTLENLRDSLLPKLMSGEIRVQH